MSKDWHVSRPLCFVFLLPAMIRAAREKGYALALHGSMATDWDLIAAPWAEEAAPAEELVEAVRTACGAIKLTAEEEQYHGNPARKPHGRRAWLLLLGGDHVVDLSVMPRLAKEVRP